MCWPSTCLYKSKTNLSRPSLSTVTTTTALAQDRRRFWTLARQRSLARHRSLVIWHLDPSKQVLFICYHESKEDFPKFRTILIRLISTAQTGYFYTRTRLRVGPRLSAVKYDPKGAILIYHLKFETYDEPVKANVLFVESRATRKKGGG